MVSKNIWLIAGGAVAALVLVVWLIPGPESESFGDEDWSSYVPDSIEPRSGTAENLSVENQPGPAVEHRAGFSTADDVTTAGVSPQGGGGLSQSQLEEIENRRQTVAAARDALWSSIRQRDRALLLQADFMPDRIDWIFERSGVLRDEFIEIYGDGASDDDVSLSSMDPDARLRADIGEEEYARYLEAIGRPRAISVDRVLRFGQP